MGSEKGEDFVQGHTGKSVLYITTQRSCQKVWERAKVTGKWHYFHCVQETLVTLIWDPAVSSNTLQLRAVFDFPNTLSVQWISELTYECKKAENRDMNAVRTNFHTETRARLTPAGKYPLYLSPESPYPLLLQPFRDCWKSGLSQTRPIQGPEMDSVP